MTGDEGDGMVGVAMRHRDACVRRRGYPCRDTWDDAELDPRLTQQGVATPGDAAKGIPSDPTNGAYIADIGDVPVDIAYGGSCTAGKRDDVDMYARVMAAAEPGEVLTSSTVKDLVVGSELQFEDRGAHELRGVPDEWRLFALAR